MMIKTLSLKINAVTLYNWFTQLKRVFEFSKLYFSHARGKIAKLYVKNTLSDSSSSFDREIVKCDVWTEAPIQVNKSLNRVVILYE